MGVYVGAFIGAVELVDLQAIMFYSDGAMNSSSPHSYTSPTFILRRAGIMG